MNVTKDMPTVGDTIIFRSREGDAKGEVVESHGIALTVRGPQGSHWVERAEIYAVFRDGVWSVFDTPDNPWIDLARNPQKSAEVAKKP